MIALIEQKQKDVAAHCRRLNVRRLDVFGSAVNGNFNPEKSDLDFFVEFGDHEHLYLFDQCFDLANSLEALFNRKVDLVTVGSVTKPRFRANLEATKEPIYVS